MASFFTPTSKKEPEKINWRVVNNTLLIGKYDLYAGVQSVESSPKRRKIAAFDLVSRSRQSRGLLKSQGTLILIKLVQDSTLVQTVSGNIFSKDSTDWRWWHPSVPSVLKKLYADGCVTWKHLTAHGFYVIMCD